MTTGKRHPRLADNPGTMHVKTCIAPDKDEKEMHEKKKHPFYQTIPT